MYYFKKLRRILSNNYKLLKLKKYYSKTNPKVPCEDKQCLIYMCDGRIHHGGLADRLSGLVSTYDYCVENNKTFKANFVFPYNLSEFLVPNEIDWTIQDDLISYNSEESRPIVISYNSSVYLQQIYAKKELAESNSQLHVYTNMKYNYPTNFKYSFHRLFRLSPLLNQAILNEKKQLPEEYVSITFRFQQLLGDLKEGNFPKIEDQGRKEQLITRCLKYIETVHRLHPHLDKFLVTSDSKTFLERASQYPYVHIIKGEIVHMDFDGYNSDVTIHLKSFIDLFMIAGAKKVYSVIEPPLYQSSFPYVASLINGTEYIQLNGQDIQ